MIRLINKLICKVTREYYSHLFYKSVIECKNKPYIVSKIHLLNCNIKCGKDVMIFPDVQFFGDGLIEIGDNVAIGNGTIIYASKEGGIKIDDNTMIAAQCYIIDCDHGIAKNNLIRLQKNVVEKVEIGKDTWVASGTKILKGAKIREGAVIGAMSLVKGEIEEYSICVGTPAKFIKYRTMEETV